ncbi:MAG: class I SAM-dependent methyltransferase [Okeania sp. SIO2C2]|uniref:class I SAM-dependent DNA methyltransferase n=1 Tax=Okeania sp. SIO2C2 TaxID=2607787 RepID=UPI0013B6341C|nr:class I SAM-dependent methyltransferase [Okeania sp. SIO2C2]NEP86483.1 class I SAM-dependent methyltransferase [Okeania sp. SIO2C2]
MEQEKHQKFLKHLEKALSEKHSHGSWALTYEEEVAAVNYQAPELLTETALKLKASGNYLDVGCGTGLVGEVIIRRQKENLYIDGCDISQEMLKVAEQKGIYRMLTCCNIFEMPYPDSSYDIVISAGVFVSNEDNRKSGSANSQALPTIIRVLKPSGYCVFSVSARVWESDSRDYERVISQLPANLIQKLEQPYHDAIPKMFNIVLQKTIC